jgi:hypothetical protein
LRLAVCFFQIPMFIFFAACSSQPVQVNESSFQSIHFSREGVRHVLVRYNPCFCKFGSFEATLDLEVQMVTEQVLLDRLLSVKVASQYFPARKWSSKTPISLAGHVKLAKALVLASKPVELWERVITIDQGQDLSEETTQLTKVILDWWALYPQAHLILEVQFNEVSLTTQGHQFRRMEILKIVGLETFDELKLLNKL